MIDKRPSTLEDIYAATKDQLEVYAGDSDLVSGCVNCLQNGRLYTLINPDGSVGGVIGGVIIWKGVATLGAVLTTSIRRYPISYMRFTNEVIGEIMTEMKLHRVEFTVKAGYETGQRWARALGFKPEGTLKHYGEDGSDYIMYGRTSWLYP